MYDELVKRLREHNGWALNETLDQAADAIEELSAICEEQKAQIITMAAEEKPRWIPVTERLPEVRTWVLCFCRANSFDVFRMTEEGHWQYGNRSIYMKGYVTHWMQLPEPPKEE